MKSNYLIAVIISVLLAGYPLVITAKEVITQNFAYVQNVVSQSLISARSGDIEGLQEAKDALPAIVSSGAVKIYRHITHEESFALKLEILEVADGLIDKSFNPRQITRAGLFGNIPWPSDKDRPESLKGRPLWSPRQNPDDFKEKNPDLYAFYKPFYEENQRNTQKHRQQGIVKNIRDCCLREVRNILHKNIDDKKGTNKRERYLTLVDTIIKDNDLKKEILSAPVAESTSEK